MSSAETANSADAVSVSDLCLGYGKTEVVHGVSFGFPDGKVTALVGPNGSGKSTILRAIARLSKPTSGTIKVKGQDLENLASRQRAELVAMLTQTRPIPSGLTVHDVVEFGRYPRQGRFRTDDPEGPAKVAEALELAGLTELADRPVGALSGGQAQRTWFAACLAQDTPVVLLDEPTTFLDLRYQVEILALARSLADQHGKTIGVVLHDLNQAANIADHVILLSQGSIRAQGTPEEVLTADRLTNVFETKIITSTDEDQLTVTAVQPKSVPLGAFK